jgi:hypothetical protein
MGAPDIHNLKPSYCRFAAAMIEHNKKHVENRGFICPT